MTFYLVAWLSVTYHCPFGLGILPQFFQDVLCVKESRIKRFITSYESSAINQLSEIGSEVPVMFLELHGTRSNEYDVKWPKTLEVKRGRK